MIFQAWAEDRAALVDYFSVDVSALGGDWNGWSNDARSSLSLITERFPTIIQMPFLPDQLIAFLNNFQATGIKVLGGMEEKVGYKSFDDLDALFEEIEVLV